jgi:uncharacterized protein (DUF58 family)
MLIKIWASITVYCAVLYFATGDLGMAVAGSFWLVFLAMIITIKALRLLEAERRYPQEQPGKPANLNQRPSRGP